MKLELTHRNLRRLTEQQDPSVDDVLNFIYDFCQDIKDDSGTPAEKLPCREEDAMYRRLPWMGRFVMKINREKEADLGEESRRERIHTITGELEGIDLQLDETKKLHQELRKQQQELLNKQETVRLEKRDILEIREENGRIESSIRELEQMDLQEYQEKKEALKAEYEEKLRSREEERQAAEADLAEFRKERETILADLTAEKDSIRSELEEEEEKLRFGDMAEFQEQIRIMKERVSTLRELQEKILRDWNSSWGDEQRSLIGGAALPEEVVKKNLAALQDKVSDYEEQLRQLTILLSSRDVI